MDTRSSDPQPPPLANHKTWHKRLQLGLFEVRDNSVLVYTIGCLVDASKHSRMSAQYIPNSEFRALVARVPLLPPDSLDKDNNNREPESDSEHVQVLEVEA